MARMGNPGPRISVQPLALLNASSRILIQVLLALFTAAIVLLAQSAFWADDVSLSVRAVLAAVAVLAFVQPPSALLVAAGLAPLSEVASGMLGSRMRGAEALVLACLTGALLRAWWTGRIRRFPTGRTETAALLFGLVIAASCVEQLWFLQLQRDFARPFLTELLTWARHDYLMGMGGFRMVFNSMLLLEGLALLVWAARASRADPRFPARLLGMVAISAVGVASVTILIVVLDFIESGRPIEGFWTFAAGQRWTVHVSDVNAAGSFFAMGFFITFGSAWLRKNLRPMRWVGALLTLAALWLTQSRAAVAAVILTVAADPLSVSLSRLTKRGLAITALLVFIFLPLVYRTRTGVALSIRWMFLETTMAMLQWQPLFGVGIGQYLTWSRHFSSPELLSIYQSENAHNNFAQVAGELGLVGLAAFLWLLARALWRWRSANGSPFIQAGLAGVVAFIVTWLAGHPLLTPAVAYPFWIALGTVAGALSVPFDHPSPGDTMPLTDGRPSLKRVTPLVSPVFACVIATVLLAASLPWRVADKGDAIDWTRVSYGFYDWEQGPSGERFRWMGGRARLFLPAAATQFTVPFRAHAVTPENPVVVDLLVNGRLANQMRMEEDVGWRSVEMVLPDNPTRREWRIDVAVSRTWTPSVETPGNTDSRALGVQVGEPVIRTGGEAVVVTP